MGCQHSHQTQIPMDLDLDPVYFSQSSLQIRKPSSETFSNLTPEIISYLKPNINYTELSLYYVCKKSQIPSKSQVPFVDFDIKPGDIIKVRVKEDLSDKVKLHFEICFGNQVKTSQDVFPVSTQIQALRREFVSEKFKEKQVKLLYEDLELENEKKLSDYKIPKTAKITVILSLPQRRCSRSPTPVWKVKRVGLIIEGTCMESKCVAFRQRVNVNKGIGFFDLWVETNERRLPCPMCSNSISKLSHVGVLGCSYKLVCRKNGQDFSNEKVAEEYQSIHLDPEMEILQVELFAIQRDN